MVAPRILSLAVKRVGHNNANQAQKLTVDLNHTTSDFMACKGIDLQQDYIHRVLHILYDKLQSESHKTYAPPTSVT